MPVTCHRETTAWSKGSFIKAKVILSIASIVA